MIRLLLPILLLTGCSTIAGLKPAPFPEAPAALLTACPDLTEIPADVTKLSQVISNVADNYSKYHVCQSQVDSWILWYDNQKTIYNNIK